MKYSFSKQCQAHTGFSLVRSGSAAVGKCSGSPWGRSGCSGSRPLQQAPCRPSETDRDHEKDTMVVVVNETGEVEHHMVSYFNRGNKKYGQGWGQGGGRSFMQQCAEDLRISAKATSHSF